MGRGEAAAWDTITYETISEYNMAKPSHNARRRDIKSRRAINLCSPRRSVEPLTAGPTGLSTQQMTPARSSRTSYVIASLVGLATHSMICLSVYLGRRDDRPRSQRDMTSSNLQRATTTQQRLPVTGRRCRERESERDSRPTVDPFLWLYCSLILSSSTRVGAALHSNTGRLLATSFIRSTNIRRYNL